MPQSITVDQPPLELGPMVHPLAESLYASLAQSPEAQFFTPAIWQRVRVHTLVLSDWLMAEKRSAMLYAAIQDDWKSFLVDSAEQRRLGIEVQRAAEVDPDDAAADEAMNVYHAQFGA